jgi:hypothetical protein
LSLVSKLSYKMQKAYIDLIKFDTQRASLRRAVERALIHIANEKQSPVAFLARPSQASEIEALTMERDNTNVVTVNNASEVLTHIKGGLTKAAGPVPNGSTAYVYTFESEIRDRVIGWKNEGWNVYFQPGTAFLLSRAPIAGAVDANESFVRSRNRKYDVAKHKAKKLRVYAEWRARRAIYDAMEIVAKDDVTLDDLKRTVMRQAREAAAAKGFDLKPYHFFAANDSVFRVALKVGVLRADGGRSISDRDVPYTVKVAGIDPDFRDRCDLFILESVINELGDVTDDQRLSLAHLMYGEGIGEEQGGSSLESLEEKFGNLMKSFGPRLGRNQDLYYRVAPEGGEKIQSIAAKSR